ncbi:hypothetical protein [Ancrocorticia populi]|uniref:hypothetical protein n=1 Tax=Ancrocorticia populi TaxID=2175228 RepID=UPI003F91260E
MDESWQETRREHARLKAEQLEASKAAQSAEAQRMLDRFVVAAREANLATEALVVKGYEKGTAKTPYRGWYLKNDRSVAVDPEGNFYLLKAFLSVRDRLRGISPQPSDPPLVLGYGGRDGEVIDLADALDKLLPGWRKAS